MKNNGLLKLVKLLLFLTIAANLNAQSLVITKLTNNFYVFTTYNDFNGQKFPSNSMYWITEDGVVLIDTPWDTTQFQPLLDSIQSRHGKKVIACISTHFHADRTAGVEYYAKKGIKTYCSDYTLRLCEEKKEKKPQYTFSKDTTFTIANKKMITYYPGKGHAPDNIVIWFPESGILYGGCFVKSTESKGLGNLSDADVAAWKKSLEKTMKKFPAPKYVISGHFDWADAKSLEHTLNLINAELKKK